MNNLIYLFIEYYFIDIEDLDSAVLPKSKYKLQVTSKYCKMCTVLWMIKYITINCTNTNTH